MLYAFQGGSDGADPRGGMVFDSYGNLFGNTEYGGSQGCGVVFKLAPDGTETVVHSFQGGNDGCEPEGNLIWDSSGNLFGTTVGGGNPSVCDNFGCGTVFEIASNGQERVVYAFQGGSDGVGPVDGLVLDNSGNFYGATPFGGAGGWGTIFKIASDGTESLLYTFQDGADGNWPEGPLILDSSGNLYGTTINSGSSFGGTVFKLAPDGTETVLYSFSVREYRGNKPEAGVIMDKAGNLYGPTVIGGIFRDCYQQCGVVFKLHPDGKETVLHAFSGVDGSGPVAPLLFGPHQELYGTTTAGGQYNYGVVFEVTK